jgi:two-component system NtrC family sensor kinase
VARSRGLQTEVLLSLLVVMVTATAMLAGAWAHTHAAHVHRLRGLMMHALTEAARSPLTTAPPSPPGTRWWIVAADGRLRPQGGHAMPIDDVSQQLGEAARERGRPLLRSGPPWSATRFAAPTGSGRVAIAWLPPAVSPALIFVLLAADVMAFTVFGAYLLRRQLVIPLQHVAAAARAIADGARDTRAPVGGIRETVEVATAFNEMSDALEEQSRDLVKAVSDLRERNRSLREARAGLDRAARLAAVGRLAAGVAHEVGNPMGAMLAFVDLAKRDARLSEESRSHLERALREGERVRAILRQLLDFSRPVRGACGPVDLSALCERTASLLRAQRRYSKIAIEVASHGEPPAAWADSNGVAQILLNLLLNAADALGPTGDPAIRVTIAPVARCVREGEDQAAAGGRDRFDAVQCLVADNGPGIADEDRERIFDPFFSTKPPGEGTGLGLSNAQRLAEEFGGSLELASKAGDAGAVFALRLPAAGEDPAQSATRGDS